MFTVPPGQLILVKPNVSVIVRGLIMYFLCRWGAKKRSSEDEDIVDKYLARQRQI